ncbi:phage/plasmid primase, P4 family [uncultured Acetobacterium sp.]|uniref:phage/plasmid primase, P4 family n=1 Tax=uncultured Acetobacterium sp. TaxID=217139 RepID=UPI0025D4593A|nr:phage/plasmid primase, P4 family [uncultured Acetobacterium sp.]
MDRRYLKMIYGNPVLVGSFIKIGALTAVYYVNQFFLIMEDFEVTLAEIELFLLKHEKANILVAPVTYYNSESATKENVKYITALLGDYDNYNGIDMKNMDKKEASLSRNAIKEVLVAGELRPSLLICSGNGLHVYYLLDKPLLTAGNVKKIERLQKTFVKQHEEFKGDPAVAVLGHTVRLPGTKNCKDPDNIKDCEIIHIDETAVYDLETLNCDLNVPEVEEQTDERQHSGSLLEAYQALNPSYEHFRQSGLQCEFMKEMARNPAKQTHGLWFHIVNNLVHFGEHGRKLLHIICEKYPGYTFEETEQLYQTTLDKVKNQGFFPTSCNRIAEDGFACPNQCAQKTPAGMMYSYIKKTLNEKPVVTSMNIDTAIRSLLPDVDLIQNLKTVELFIETVINPLPDSIIIKDQYLRSVLTKMGLNKTEHYNPFKKMLKNTAKGKTGNTQVDIAEEVQRETGLRCLSGDFYIYHDGVWEPHTEMVTKKVIKKLGSEFSEKVLNGIIRYLRDNYYLSPEQINQHVKEKMICLKNGMLKIHKDGKVELLAHSPDYFALNRLDISYDPTAKCLKFDRFITECFKNLEPEDRRLTIQAQKEWFGYGIVPGNEMHKMGLLLGLPRTGKGVMLSVYSKLLGQGNISNIPLSELHKPINSIQLLNHLANVSPEFNENERFNEAFIKSATGEDGISGKDHYKKAESFVNQCKLMGSANYLPRYFEKSGALEKRLLLFPFDNQIPDDEQNIELKEELLEELPGILNFAIEGRICLFDRGRFIESPSMLKLKKKAREKNNLVLQWFNDEKRESLLPGQEYEPLKLMIDEFRIYCVEEGIKTVPKRSSIVTELKRIPGLRIEKKSKPNQECVFFEWEKLGVEVAELETTDVKSAASFDLTDEFVLLEDSENTTGDQTPQTEISEQLGTTEQSEIDLRVINLLENKHSDVRAFN